MLTGLTINKFMAALAVGGLLIGVGGNIKTTQANSKAVEKQDIKLDKVENIQIKQTVILEGVIKAQDKQNILLDKLLEK